MNFNRPRHAFETWCAVVCVVPAEKENRPRDDAAGRAGMQSGVT